MLPCNTDTLLLSCWYPTSALLAPCWCPAGALPVPCWCPARALLVPCPCPAGALLVPCWRPAGALLVPYKHPTSSLPLHPSVLPLTLDNQPAGTVLVHLTGTLLEEYQSWVCPVGFSHSSTSSAKGNCC